MNYDWNSRDGSRDNEADRPVRVREVFLLMVLAFRLLIPVLAAIIGTVVLAYGLFLLLFP